MYTPKYKVTHKGLDCEDDLRSLKYNEKKSSALIEPFNGLLNDLERKEKSLKLQGIVYI